jgi:hypothetical protein
MAYRCNWPTTPQRVESPQIISGLVLSFTRNRETPAILAFPPCKCQASNSLVMTTSFQIIIHHLLLYSLVTGSDLKNCPHPTKKWPNHMLQEIQQWAYLLCGTCTRTSKIRALPLHPPNLVTNKLLCCICHTKCLELSYLGGCWR